MMYMSDSSTETRVRRHILLVSRVIVVLLRIVRGPAGYSIRIRVESVSLRIYGLWRRRHARSDGRLLLAANHHGRGNHIHSVGNNDHRLLGADAAARAARIQAHDRSDIDAVYPALFASVLSLVLVSLLTPAPSASQIGEARKRVKSLRMNTDEIQKALRESNLDGWLFFDHHRRDPLAYRILGIPDEVWSQRRRWYYFVPADGEPRKLVHRIESGALDALAWPKGNLLQLDGPAEETWSSAVGLLANRHAIFPQLRDSLCFARGCAARWSWSAAWVWTSSARRISFRNLKPRWTEEQFNLHVEAGKFVDETRSEAFQLHQASDFDAGE